MSAAAQSRHARLFELIRQENMADQRTLLTPTELEQANGPELVEMVRYLNGSLVTRT